MRCHPERRGPKRTFMFGGGEPKDLQLPLSIMVLTMTLPKETQMNRRIFTQALATTAWP